MIARVLYILTLNSELYLLIVEIYSEECIPCKCEGVGLDLSCIYVTVRTGIKSKPHHPLLRIGAEVALRWAVVFRSQEVGV